MLSLIKLYLLSIIKINTDVNFLVCKIVTVAPLRIYQFGIATLLGFQSISVLHFQRLLADYIGRTCNS